MPPWERAWLKSRTNPLLFATDVLGAVPEPWQAEALTLIGQNDRLSIRAGHGVGKTTFEAWVAIWFGMTRHPWRILVSANTQDQIKDTIWPEIVRWIGALPQALRDELEITGDHIYLAADKSCFITARTASKDNPSALQGLHSDNMLVILDEAPGIPDIVFEMGIGTLSTVGAKFLMCGNPTHVTGYFHDTHHALRARWKTMRVNSEDVPRARGHIEDIIAKYGKESNAYRVRVLGEFPDTEDDAVIPLHLCEAAVSRSVRATDFRPVWGLDVARFGDDRTALCKRQGNTVLEPIRFWRGKDTMQTAGLIVDEWKACHELDRPTEILVDVIGLGAGVVDRCRELSLPVRGVNVGESAAVSDRFMRRRDELWWAARDWLSSADCKLPEDDALIGELTGPKYTVLSTGKVQIERKDEMKKRLGWSPDLADAFILTFAGGLEKKLDEEIDRYRRKLYGKRAGSYMSA